jgi:hypothetical protein
VGFLRHNAAKGVLNVKPPNFLRNSPHWALHKNLEPISISGTAISLDNPNTWLSYDDAIDAYEHNKERFDGIGYIVVDEALLPQFEAGFYDPLPGVTVEELQIVEDNNWAKGRDPESLKIIGISLDNCRDPITGEASKWANCILRRLKSPSNVNASGTGFTAFCIGTLSHNLTKITSSGPDDLTLEAKNHITSSDLNLAAEVESGKPVFNLVEIHQGGPRYFAITGEWLEDYPLEMEDRTRELEEIRRLWTPIHFWQDMEDINGAMLPHLDILQAIDTSGFTKIGDEFVGIPPLFQDQNCLYLKVNPDSNVFYFSHEERDLLGDAWLWLATESGAVDWRNITEGMLYNTALAQKVKEYAIFKGYFTEDELFPERKLIRDALQTLKEIKDKALEDPGLPFEEENIEALAIVKLTNQAEYERIKSFWNNKISIGELKKAVEKQAYKVQAKFLTAKGSKFAAAHTGKKVPLATQLIDSILEEYDGHMELWHSTEGGCYISLSYTDGHFEHRFLRAKSTKQWLSSLYHDKTGTVASSSTLNNTITVLEGYAMKGPCYPHFIRVAEANGAIYIDLGDDTWKAVKITSNGWEIVKKTPVRFRRPKGLLPLPAPLRGGSLNDLRPILNIENDEIWLLIKGWLVGALSPSGPYPVLAISGEQGSAKTWVAKILRSLIDPNSLPSSRPPKSTEDLMIAANNNWLVSLDNLSRISKWLSDSLCNLATGGGLSKRELYTDADQTILRVCRAIILNGIEDIVTRQDLLDRSICIAMQRIPDSKRRTEADLLEEFNRLHPKLLGALFDAVVVGLQRKGTIQVAELPRMADFAKWAAAALGDEGTKFLAAYQSNRDHAVVDALEGDPIAESLTRFLDTKQGWWSGTATELLEELNAVSHKPAGWPRAPNALSGILRRLAPALRKIGIYMEFSRDETIRSKMITIIKGKAGG